MQMRRAIHASSVLASFFAEPEPVIGYVKDFVHALGLDITRSRWPRKTEINTTLSDRRARYVTR